MKTVNLGSVPIGDDHPVVLMAEIGTFFNQDIALAKEYLSAIAAAGVPVFKTEILHNADVCLRDSGLDITFSHSAGKKTESYRALIERKTVPLEHYAQLFAQCRELGIPFTASVYDFEGVDFFVKEGGAGLKIARHNITNLPLIRKCAQTGLPVLFDAGLVYLDEIAVAVRTAREEGADVIVNHHPGPNPTPAEKQNLRVIRTWKETFDAPAGLACHYRGDEILFAAVGIGVNLIEKGVVDDNTRVEQDVVSALNLTELAEFHRKLLNCWRALGSRFPVVPEPRDLSVRKGASASRDLAEGEALTLENTLFAWPPHGVPAESWDIIEGRKLRRAVKAGLPVRWEDIDFD